MIAQPIVAEVAGWFATPNISVVIHKFHVFLVSTEFICDLQFSVHPSYNALSRNQTRPDLAIQRGVEVNNGV
jgi:hypothetical protein